MDLKLPYALKDGELVTIDKVKSGKACDCICIECREILIARKGQKRIPHFAHASITNCQGGIETALHLKCKELIAQSNTFVTPEYRSNGIVIKDKYTVPVEKVVVEKKLGEIIPDLVIFSNSRMLLLEIVVTNPVSSTKLEKIKKEKLSAITIDVSVIVKKLFDKKNFDLDDDSFKTAIIEGTEFKRWINCPRLDQEAKRILLLKEEKLIHEEQKRKEALKKKLSKRIQFEKELLLHYDGSVKLVKSFDKDDGSLFIYVEDCPIYSRSWRSGKNKGKPFANVYHDCYNCIFFGKMEHQIESDEQVVYCYYRKVRQHLFTFEGNFYREYILKQGVFRVDLDTEQSKYFHRFRKAYHYFLDQDVNSTIWDCSDKKSAPVLLQTKILKQREINQTNEKNIPPT